MAEALTAQHFADVALEAYSELQRAREDDWLDQRTIAEWMHASYYAGALGMGPDAACRINQVPQVRVRLLERDGVAASGAGGEEGSAR